MRDYERQELKARLAHRLRALGWTVFGVKEDRSDSMTDYFDPADWAGVATFAGGRVVLCVGVSKYTASSRSGHVERRLVPTQGDPCPRCKDAPGYDPTRWTLAAARQSPNEYTRQMLEAEHGPGHGMFAQAVVSPIPFHADGWRKCVKCHGSGRLPGKPREEVGPTWPAFGANPPFKQWHLELDGKVADSGTGLKACETQEGAAALADELTRRACRLAPQEPAFLAEARSRHSDKLILVRYPHGRVAAYGPDAAAVRSAAASLTCVAADAGDAVEFPSERLQDVLAVLLRHKHRVALVEQAT